MRLDLYDNRRFDRGANRLKEAAWLVCKRIFFLGSFPWPSSIRVFFLRLFGAQVGSNVVIRSGVHITFPWRMQIGSHVWIGEEVYILSLAPVLIGSHVCISQRAFLCTGSHQWKKETFDLITKPIEIGSSVWIAAMTFVGPGVAIGSHSIINAASVVTKSVPSHSLVKSNPAETCVRQDLAPS